MRGKLLSIIKNSWFNCQKLIPQVKEGSTNKKRLPFQLFCSLKILRDLELVFVMKEIYIYIYIYSFDSLFLKYFLSFILSV